MPQKKETRTTKVSSELPTTFTAKQSANPPVLKQDKQGEKEKSNG